MKDFALLIISVKFLCRIIKVKIKSENKSLKRINYSILITVIHLTARVVSWVSKNDHFQVRVSKRTILLFYNSRPHVKKTTRVRIDNLG